jgi:hypothetical protein
MALKLGATLPKPGTVSKVQTVGPSLEQAVGKSLSTKTTPQGMLLSFLNWAPVAKTAELNMALQRKIGLTSQQPQSGSEKATDEKVKACGVLGTLLGVKPGSTACKVALFVEDNPVPVLVGAVGLWLTGPALISFTVRAARSATK